MKDSNKSSADHKNTPLSKNGAKRKRGIIASRAKLEQIMRLNGLKTQASLADKIADLEGLENAPRDMVNRVFRGMPVEPHTLERVSAALNVDAYSLYLSSDEVEQKESIEQNNKLLLKSTDTGTISPSSISKIIKYASLLLVLLLLAIISKYFIFDIVEEPYENKLNHSGNVPISMVIVGLDKLNLSEFPELLAEQLGSSYSISNSNIMNVSSSISPWEIPNKLNVDYALHIHSKDKGRYSALFINLFGKNKKQLVYANAWSKTSIENKQQNVILKTAGRIQSLFGLFNNNLSVSDTSFVPFKEEAVDAYLNGMDTVDKALNLSYVNQSLQSFEHALVHSPDFLKAQAAKCETMSRSYFISKDIGVIKKAQEECEKFDDAGSDSAEYQYAMGQIYRRQGNLEKAEGRFLRALQLEENYVDALLGLAENEVSQGVKNQDLEKIKKAIATAQHAINIAPNFWKVYHTQGRMNYYSGNSLGAIEHAEKSVSLSPNLTALNNLANYHFCNGKMSRSKEIYEQMQGMKYASPLVKFQLGAVYSFYSENEKAAELMEQYLDEVKDDNGTVLADSLIGLADVYNEMSENDKASENYLKAYEQLEKERLNGQDNPMIQTQLLYIKLAMNTLGNSVLEPQELNDFTQKFMALEAKSNNPEMKIRLLFSWILMENWQRGKVMYDQVAPLCKALADHPNFDRFRTDG